MYNRVAHDLQTLKNCVAINFVSVNGTGTLED